MKQKWFAFDMDNGLVAISETKRQLVNYYSDNNSSKRIANGYEISSANNESVNTLFIYNDISKAKQDGWGWALSQYKKDKTGVLVLKEG